MTRHQQTSEQANARSLGGKMSTSETAGATTPTVVLFGYDFFVIVPSMMPRPILVDNFNLTYRKIPVLLIDKDIYIDTSLIFDIIHTHSAFPSSAHHPPLHSSSRDRVLSRLLSSHYTDRPLFRLTTGLIPQAVWETRFGDDRTVLIGHKLDARKLGAKIPQNLAALDTHLSILEPHFSTSRGWILDTPMPSGVDIAFYYQLKWGEQISRGEGINDLTGGSTPDSAGNGIAQVFNYTRYPNLMDWYDRMTRHMDNLPSKETRIERQATDRIETLMQTLNTAKDSSHRHHHPHPIPLMNTAAANLNSLNDRLGLTIGAQVSVTPDDTGREHPTHGRLLCLSTEEIVISPDPVDGKIAIIEGIRAHFPRVGFVVKPRPVGLNGSDQRQRELSVKSRL